MQKKSLNTDVIWDALRSLDTHPIFSAGMLIVLLTSLAWANRFFQDDAFISFRYALNAVQGHGLVWNEGQRVEGYTNFLWTVFMMVPHYLNIDPVAFSEVLGMFFFVITLSFAYRASFLVMKRHRFALLTVAVVGTNYSFSSYATGGMETQMQACLILISMYMVLANLHSVNWPLADISVLSLATSLSLLTRLDSSIPAAVTFPLALGSILRSETALARKIVQILTLFVPVFVLVGGWMLWKLNYYGTLIPNSFYAKVSVTGSFSEGIGFVCKFFTSYWLWPYVLLLPFASKKLRQESNLGVLALFVTVLIWLVYLMVIGGDFMEFRFMVPIWPLLAIFLVWLLFTVVRKTLIRAIFVGLVFCGSLYHALTFDVYRGIDSIHGLASHVCGTPLNWTDVGKALATCFGGGREVVIATTAAGAIPYYSHLKTVDMLGLNDGWVARNGIRIKGQPGHHRLAPLEYLLARGVNLAIGHPVIFNRVLAQPPKYHLEDLLYFRPVSRSNLPADFCAVEIPLNDEYALLTLYLVHSPLIDKVIAENNWRRVPVVMNSDQRERTK